MIATSILGCTRYRYRIRTEALPFGGILLQKYPLFSNRTKIIKLFSSSSSPSKTEPRLSYRNKRDLLILTTGIFGAFGYHLIHRDSNWEKDICAIQNKLITSSARQNKDCNKYFEESSLSNRPPPVVLRYIKKALQQPVSSLRTPSYNRELDRRRVVGETAGISRQKLSSLIVNAHQSGEFFAAQQWYPFEATLMATASAINPGFVWDAQTTIMNISNRILEYYITHTNDNSDGNEGQPQTNKTKIESNLITKVWGKYPLIQIEEEDPYVLFWLAMTPLFPAVFLPHKDENAGILKWNDNDVVFSTNSTTNSRKNAKLCASAQLADGADTTFSVEFFFREEDDLLHKIKVTSLSQSDNQNKVQQPWQAIYNNYEQHVVIGDWEDDTDIEDRLPQDQKSRQVLVPSSIEIGKGEGDQYRPHFKINNSRLNYKR